MLGKVLAAIASILILLIAAMLVGPSFVDWNNYKLEIVQLAKRFTGRDLEIKGDIGISILPAPAAHASDVTLSNAPGASEPHMVRLKSVEVRVALVPLLGGQVKVETVRLVEPVVNIERLADGSSNLVFTPMDEKSSAADAQPSSGENEVAPSSEPSVVLDDFTIEGGTVIYRDATTELVERIEAINARVEAASLQGPFRATGSLAGRDTPLGFDLSSGDVMQGRSFPVNAVVTVEQAGTTLQANGTIIGLADQPRFKGNLKFDSSNLAALLEAAGITGLPAVLAQSFGFSGALTASAKGAEMKDFTLAMNGTQVNGDIAVDLGDKIDTALRLSIKSVDLNKWLETAAAAEPSDGGSDKTTVPSAATTGKNAEAGNAASSVPTVALPANLSGSLILLADAVAYRGGLIRDLLVNAELGEGEVTISQVSAQFPGGSDLAVFGTVSLKDGAPSFGGEVETTINDLRRVMSWLDLDIAGVPADRLRKMRVASKVAATPAQIQVSGLDFQFDSSRITGAVTVALRKRPSFGASLILDRINLDAYLPPDAGAGTGKPANKAATEEPSAGTGASPDKNTKPAANPFTALAALTQFDANVKSRIQTLVYQGEQVKGLAVDATLYNGNLTLRNLSVGKLAGASAVLKGVIENLGGLPKAKGLEIDFESKNIAPLLRLAQVDPPIDVRKVGAVSLSGRLDGPLLKPQIDYTVKGAGATVSAKGTINVLPVGNMADLALRIRHPDFARFLRIAGTNYRPSGKIGGIDLSANVKGGTDAFTVNGLAGKIGSITVNGSVAANLKGARPAVTADIKTGPVEIDPFLPAAAKANVERWRGLVRKEAGWVLPDAANDNRPALRQIATRGRWSADPIDLSALGALDADLLFRAPIVTFDKYLVEQADLKAALKNGTLSIERFTGKLFDGQLNANGAVTAGSDNRISLVANLAKASVVEATQSVTGASLASGQMSANLNLSTSGRSVADFVAALAGDGALTMTDVDPAKGGEGLALAGILDLLTTLNQLGGSRKGTSADVSGTFRISRGVARSQDFRLVSGVGNGGATGTVDLPSWKMDIKGQVELAQNVLTRLLKAKVRETRNAVAFSVVGPLDAPKVNVDTGALLGSAAPIPGAEELLDKAPKGVGNVLKGLGGVLGGKPQQGTGQDDPPLANTGGNVPPPPRSTTKQQPTNSLEKLLKGILK